MERIPPFTSHTTHASPASGLVVAQLSLTWSTLSMELVVACSAALVAGLIAWGSWRFFRRRHRPRQSATPPNQQQPLPREEHKVGEGRTTPVPGDSGPLHALSAPDEPTPQKILFAGDDDLARRQCAQCERSFPGFFEVCPFDGTTLHAASQSSSDPQDSQPLARRYCPDCDRRFELSAQYCYHDATELKRDTDRHSRRGDLFHICRHCGWEDQTDDPAGCPRCEHPLTTINPDNRDHIAPQFPFNRCRQCGHIAPPNEVICPVDHSLLLPESNARLTALPTTGFGDRRKICPECGRRFNDQASFCSVDATALIHLN